jgi:hypothetical protein
MWIKRKHYNAESKNKNILEDGKPCGITVSCIL